MLEAETSQAGEVIKTEQVTNLPLAQGASAHCNHIVSPTLINSFSAG